MDYPSLKKRVEKAGGLRLAAHGSLRDQIVDLAVLEWPADCPADRLFEVLHARVSRRVRQGRSRMAGMFLSALMVKPVARICVEWYLEKPSHRVLMEGWRAKAAKDL